MIDGVTKPFELGGSQLSPEEMRAATAAYITGMTDLLERFMGENILDLEVPLDDFGTVNVIVDRGMAMALISTDAQLHSYGLGSEGVVRRHDSRSLDATLDAPDIERTMPRGASVEEGLAALKRQVAEEDALGINYQPVDLEEVTNLFALLQRATTTELE